MDISVQVFLALSLVMAIIITLLFIVNAIFTTKISAKFRYFMWIVIMIGLLVPLRPSIGNGIIDISNFTPSPPELAGYSTPEFDAIATGETPEIPPDVTRQDIEAIEQIPFQTIVFAIWLTVAIGIISYHLFQYVRFGRSIRRWGEIEEDENTLVLFDRVKREMNLRNSKVQLIVCGFISTSMLTGFLKPVILLPEKNYDDGELELIFRHELIHYRRKDLWIKLLSVVAMAIHWFNPLVYLMNLSLQTEGEASCDQEVLEMSKLKSRHSYAEVIIGMIGGKKSGMTTLTTNFYGGKKGIKRRLEEIMAGTTPRKSTSYVFLAVILLLTVMSGSVFAMQTTSATEQNTTEESTENNDDDIFELAIAAVGGGIVTEYHQLSDDLLLVYVTYDDEIFLVEIDLINHRVIGLSIYRENDELIIDDNPQETDETSDTDEPIESTESVESDVDEIPTETNPAPSPEETQISEISSEHAVQIASGVAPGRVVEVSRDWKNGRSAWWIEIRHNGMVHEFYIDMETGAILEHEFELDD